MAEVEFLFGAQLISELEKLIKNSKKELLLISPFIDLDKRIEDALRVKLNDKRFKLRVLFGKNEHDLYKSIKKNSLEFFKEFPNVEIRYAERLHAKFYKNDYGYIMTSMNLYDYSLSKNIEVGIKSRYTKKGLIWQPFVWINRVWLKSIDFIAENIFGEEKDVDPIQEFEKIFFNSEIKYQTRAILGNKNGIIGKLGVKEIKGKQIEQDHFPEFEQRKKAKKKSDIVTELKIEENILETKSGSTLSKKMNISLTQFNVLMEENGLIENGIITEKGLGIGLQMKRYMGKDYIAYPESIIDLIESK